MDSLKPTLEELNFCMRDPDCIRNVCILAHVDHGKTTIADSLLATNRLVSKRLAGFLRYLDDRPDEQERGITMKSSAVSLLNLVHDEEDNKNKRILLNLIDTPGHIDFSTEVGAALRVSDGAIILVDLVEGVCVQTRESIKNAFEEHTQMILVLNKFDRLIVELQKNIDEIFQCILRIIEGCNAIVAELYQYEFTDTDVDVEDTGLLFCPNTGNVIFASAVDGWGFTTKQMAGMFVNIVKNETVESLNEKMWNFDCFIDSKKEIKTGAIDKKKNNLFVQLCLKTIVHIYETFVIRMERNKTSSILEKLNITNITRDMTHNDPKVQVRAVLQAWRPLASTILLQCLKKIPSPSKMKKTKVEYLLRVNRFCEDQYLNKCVENMLPFFESISTESATPTIVYVSKMFCVNKKNLSQNKPKIFVPKPRTEISENQKLSEICIKEKPEEENTDNPVITVDDDIKVIALARVFTGILRVGQEIFVLTGSYLPNENKICENPEDFLNSNGNLQKTTIKELYMLFGRELLLVDAIPAGNFCGIGGIESHILRTATLSTILDIVPLAEHPRIDPVVRHAVEPENLKDLPILRQGLKYLMHSDSCVEVVMQETGELVLLTAGDVHLGKCIEDLKTKFAKIDINVSSPMVSLRETIVVNQNDDYNFVKDTSNYVSLDSEHFSMSVIAKPLPDAIREVIQNNYEFLKMVEEHQHKSFIDVAKQQFGRNSEENIEIEKTFMRDTTKKALTHIKEQLESTFASSVPCWKDLQNKLWSIGKSSNCLNVLINNASDYPHSIFMELSSCDKRALYDHCIIKAFNTLCKAGPLCEEPLTNCAFIINKFDITKDVNREDLTPQTTSALESNIRETLKKSLEKQNQRLMEPIYVTEIQVNTSILGKVYTVVNKRHGKIIEDVCMDEQEKIFLVKAQIPVIASEGFANEIRKTTSGQANPTLRFSHYEVIDGDPFYQPVEDDDEDEEGINVESALRANKLMKDARRRKGLHVDDEVVIHAEKQRTKKK
ncbi:unnamed protein product [Phaedon cochleariae]|uniref:Tr-type G domain-containing protein n=1 Tax=Phaedon cochleariae TaxID=80249 RepID=A0A9N9X053_PHACE|nr:unnamed protein product [Phaedon cochleariae]